MSNFGGTIIRRVNPDSQTTLFSCADKRGNVLATREVIVDRGDTVDVGNACKRVKD